MMPVHPASGERTILRELIDERGIRYSFVAEKLGLTPSHFTRLMNKERIPTEQAVIGLEELLGVSRAVFFDGRELLASTNGATEHEGVEND